MNNDIKSQDDIRKQETRSSDVLIALLEKCSLAESKNKHLSELLLNQDREIEKLKEKLKKAVEVLEVISTHTIIADDDMFEQICMVYNWSCKALDEIKELDK